MLAHAALTHGVQLVANHIVYVAAVSQLLILKVLGAGVGGAHQYEHALALLFHKRHIGLDGIQAHVGGQGDEVGLEIALEVSLGVHLGGLGDVAALDVGNHRHAGGLHVVQGLLVGVQAVQTQALVVSNLHLEAACHRLGGVHNGLVEAHDVLTGSELSLGKALRQIGKIGVQSHAHRAAGSNSFVQFVHVGHCEPLLFIFFIFGPAKAGFCLVFKCEDSLPLL